MNNIDKNSDNKKLINSEQDTLKQNITNTKDIILDTRVNITVELGKSQIKIKDFLNFSKGSMLILDKLIKEPLDILVNGDVIAFGEIVFLEKEYGLRITGIKKSLKTIHMSV